MFVLPILALAAAIFPGAVSKSTDGDITVTINGMFLDPTDGKEIKLENLGAPTSRILVRGRHMGFDLDPTSLNLFNYTLTGFPDDRRIVTQPTVIFTSKTITLTKAQLGTINIKKLEVKDDSAVILFETGAGKVKYQINDGAQGGIIQVETEFSSNVEFIHTLGPKLFYFINPFTNKTNYGDGLAGVTKAQSATGFHEMLIGKDSPQVANRTFQDGATSRWSVAPGGRVGGVLGEDATELGPGATDCTSMCQAQNRIRGSLPNPGAPEGPDPIPGGGEED
ncbi:hypothetical protein C8J57DRAFT_575541 [Mycena rebaudengoi]|nr:hypothetical protein C8J57DRAFT_575541 [Mycena rebaudengoi]